MASPPAASVIGESGPVYRIRLRGFWTVEPLPDGTFRHRRSFGKPRTLDPNERAYLVIDVLPTDATISINGLTLSTGSAGQAWSHDVTEQLQARNEVAIVLTSADTLGDVALGITST